LCDSNSAKIGGCLYMINQDILNSTIINSNFSLNKALDMAGSIYYSGSQNLNIINCLFDSN
jgi:hypothetical protein